MIKPQHHVFFIGPRKTGTTTIYDVIRSAGVRTPTVIKETFYFENDTISFDEYAVRFALDPAQPFVEVSPSYFSSPSAMENIRTYFPDAWIVITLRDPVARCLSAISHLERIGLASFGYDVATNEFEANKHIRTMIATSQYEDAIDQWAAAFPGRTIVMRQTDAGTFDPASLAKTAETCGVPLPADAMLATRSNNARRSVSPALMKRSKKILRKLDNLGLGFVRRSLKPASKLLYRPAPAPNPHIEALLTARLSESRAYYRRQPLWSLR